MRCFTYEIKSPALKPFIEFLLFNFSGESSSPTTVTYYPNNDVCLGIIYQKEIIITSNGGFAVEKTKRTVNSYLTGMYNKPHQLLVSGDFDEICLPFSPLGCYQFFRIPLQKYILQADVLKEEFGAAAVSYFEKVFEEKDLQKRGELIEFFLQQRLLQEGDNFLKPALHHLHENNGTTPIKEILFKLKCSEKKLQRTFLRSLDTLPKEYQQILKFRKALSLMNSNNYRTLTNLCYEAGYYDQSHFIRNINSYTGRSPAISSKT